MPSLTPGLAKDLFAGKFSMNQELVSVVNQQISLVTYHDQPVVTFAMIDQIHQRVEGTAGRNFHQNKHRFVEGKHYFMLQGQELNEFRTLSPGVVGCNIPKLILLTERGYCLVVKSLTDDLSWTVQERMADAYFCAKSALGNDTVLSSIRAEIDAIKARLPPVRKTRKPRGLKCLPGPPPAPSFYKKVDASSQFYWELFSNFLNGKEMVTAKDLRANCAPELSAVTVGRIMTYNRWRSFALRIGDQVLRVYRGYNAGV